MENTIKNNSLNYIRDRTIKKAIIYLLLCLAIFIKGYGDIVIQETGVESGVFQSKHFILMLVGMISLLFSKKSNIFNNLYALNTYISVSILLFVFSLVNIIFNGNPSMLTIQELFFYIYPMITAVGMSSFFKKDELQKIMTIAFLLYASIYIYRYQDVIFSFETYRNINFSESYSPLEDSFFSPGMDGFFIFFIMTSNKKIIMIISCILNFMVFKRISVIFIPIFILTRLVIDENKATKKNMWIVGCVVTFLASIIMFNVMQPEFLFTLAYRFPNLDLQYLFMGRHRMFEILLRNNFQSSGLGTTQNVLGSIFENEALKVILEVGYLGLAAILCGLWKLTKNNMRCLVVITYISLTFLNATVLFGSPSPNLMFPIYLTILTILDR